MRNLTVATNSFWSRTSSSIRMVRATRFQARLQVDDEESFVISVEHTERSSKSTSKEIKLVITSWMREFARRTWTGKSSNRISVRNLHAERRVYNSNVWGGITEAKHYRGTCASVDSKRDKAVEMMRTSFEDKAWC